MGDKVWVCQFVDMFVCSSQFDCVVRSLDNLSSTLLNEASSQHATVDHALSQEKVLMRVYLTRLFKRSEQSKGGGQHFSESHRCVCRWCFRVKLCGWNLVGLDLNVIFSFGAEIDLVVLWPWLLERSRKKKRQGKKDGEKKKWGKIFFCVSAFYGGVG